MQVDHWRTISHQMRGSSISSGGVPAKRSAVTADDIAGGLHRVHVDFGKGCQRVGRIRA